MSEKNFRETASDKGISFIIGGNANGIKVEMNGKGIGCLWEIFYFSLACSECLVVKKNSPDFFCFQACRWIEQLHYYLSCWYLTKYSKAKPYHQGITR